MASVFNKLNLFFRNIYLDYYEVFREIQRNAKDRPLKASLYGASTLFVLNLFRTNEDLRSYQNEVTSACIKIGSVIEQSRNPESNRFVKNVGELNCHGTLRQLDLGFSTLVYKADSSTDLALFKYNCSYMKPSLKEFFLDRIVDLGFLGHWLILELKMRDYDINEEEYSDFESGDNVQHS